MTLLCTRCKQTKPLEAFSPAKSKRGRHYWCKPCGVDYHKERAAENADYWRIHNLKKLYGITIADFDALLAAQDGVCAVCKASGKRLVVDHDHSTGQIRGILCDPCNRALGLAQDDADRLRALADYLERT